MTKKEKELLELKLSITNITRKAFLRMGYSNKSNAKKIIGCKWCDLKKHIEEQFIPNMNWDNRGRFGWHIDHIIPLAFAKNKRELLRLSKYNNLQPMWWKENLKKNRFLKIQTVPNELIDVFGDIIEKNIFIK